MRRVYNQKNTTLTVDGVTIQDFFEGASITFTYDGGEVDKTQGTDGASVNMATMQGATIAFTLRETSRSREFLKSLHMRQYNGGDGVTVVFRSGADVIETMTNAYIGNPGEVSTGDKKQAGVQYTLTSAEASTDSLGVVSGAISAVTSLL